jgi:DNA-binding NarL/FixJ family response regulator
LSISVSIVEDDASVREILVDWIRQDPGLRLVSHYNNPESALARLPEEKPEVILMDINLSGKSGIDCVYRLKQLLPATQFLMLTVYEDADHIFDALRAGASGYLLKRTPREELLEGIRQVREGGAPMTSYIARKVVHSFHQQPSTEPSSDLLSPREWEVLRLLARGFAYKEICQELNVSMSTVNTHVHRIYEKLHVRSRGEAVARFASFPPSRPATPASV